MIYFITDRYGRPIALTRDPLARQRQDPKGLDPKDESPTRRDAPNA